MAEDHLQEQSIAPKKKRDIWTKLNTTIVLLILLIIIAVLVPVSKHYLEVGEARNVLRSAKNVRLAAQVTAYDYKELKDTFRSPASRDGMKTGVAESILETADSKGSIHYLEFDETKFEVKELIYIEDGYCAVCVRENGELAWTVYRMSKRIDF